MIVYQNNPALPWWFRRFGCAVRTGIRIGELESGYNLDPETMLRLHDILCQTGSVRTDRDEPDPLVGWYCLVNYWENALNTILAHFRIEKKAQIVGEQVFIPTRNRPASWGEQSGDYAIIEGRMKRRDEAESGFRSHFLLELPDGGRFDPHDPPIPIDVANRRMVRLTEV